MLKRPDILSDDYHQSVYMAEKRYRRQQLWDMLRGPLVAAGVHVLLLGAIAWSISADRQQEPMQWQTVICYNGVPMEAIYGDSEGVERVGECLADAPACFTPDGKHDPSSLTTTHETVALGGLTMIAVGPIECSFGVIEPLTVEEDAVLAAPTSDSEATETLAVLALEGRAAEATHAHQWRQTLVQLRGMGMTLAGPYKRITLLGLSMLGVDGDRQE